MTRDGSGVGNMDVGIVYLENKGRRADERSADGCNHVVRLPTSGRKPTLASLAAGAFSPYQLHCPARPTRPNVVLAGPYTFASGRAVSRSGSFQGQLQHSLSFMTSVCLPVMSWMRGFREAVRRYFGEPRLRDVGSVQPEWSQRRQVVGAS